MLRQRRHLADLGLAVAKINHDLRNTLTSAQMLSDQVVALDDPKIQRLAPRLVQSIDKAVGFAQSVLDYGRQSGTPPKPVPVDLRALVDESAIDADAMRHPGIAFSNGVPDGVTIKVDPEQLARVLVNLLKNAREALETAADKPAESKIEVSFSETPTTIGIAIADNGPGLPPRARENLFVAFEGSAKAGGTGLGLAIARELVTAHGGTLSYAPLTPGTRFDISFPRSIRLD
jgi:signal transduction histidine kinase